MVNIKRGGSREPKKNTAGSATVSGIIHSDLCMFSILGGGVSHKGKNVKGEISPTAGLIYPQHVTWVSDVLAPSLFCSCHLNHLTL